MKHEYHWSVVILILIAVIIFLLNIATPRKPGNIRSLARYKQRNKSEGENSNSEKENTPSPNSQPAKAS